MTEWEDIEHELMQNLDGICDANVEIEEELELENENRVNEIDESEENKKENPKSNAKRNTNADELMLAVQQLIEQREKVG
mmetsp:Transcript_9368/g.16889  ORF Transcript_9368/g.16889 Transcript_9368/m.16889 type:complete len:80 (-) Transcript_9368:2078-2317(-)